MAILQHTTLPHASVHEPRWIGLNGTSASGKVITNSSSATGISEYRNLAQADLTDLEVLWQIQEFDGTVAQTHYIPATFAGDITQIDGIVNTAVAGGTNTYEMTIDAVTVTGSSHSFTVTPGSGGTAGDIITASPSAQLIQPRLNHYHGQHGRR